MSATVPLMDLEILADLDFDPADACEHSQHEQRHIASDPGRYLVQGKTCPSCGWEVGRYIICESGWRVLGRHKGVFCRGCGAESTRDLRLKIIADLRGNV